MEAVPAYPLPHAVVHVLPLAVALQPSTGRTALAGGAGRDAESQVVEAACIRRARSGQMHGFVGSRGEPAGE